MGSPSARYACKAVAGVGWKIWDRKQKKKKWWGNPCSIFPDELLKELNGPKRPDELVRLSKPANSSRS